MIIAEEIMSDHVVVIYNDMLVHQVAHLMLRDRVSGFPVINKGVGLVGIITITDLFAMIQGASDYHQRDEFFKKISEFKNLTVEDVMSKEVVSIKPETTINEIVRLVVDKGMHVFPVMQDEKIIGIVSRHDILNAIFASEEN